MPCGETLAATGESSAFPPPLIRRTSVDAPLPQADPLLPDSSSAEPAPQAPSEIPAAPEIAAQALAAPEPPEPQALLSTAPPTSLAEPPRDYADRSTGLTVFGIIQILLGLLATLGIPFVLLSAVMTRKAIGASGPPGTYVQGMIQYGLLAAAFITLGIGSIRARRWAWALTLTSSWIWLIVGSAMTVMIAAVMPAIFMAGMRTAGSSAAPMPRGLIAVVITFVIVVIAFFLIMAPAAFLIFYRREDVEATCKRRDPQERWTDRCPLPVLAVSLMFTYGAIYYAVNSFTTPLIPFFGRWLTGWPGGVACLLLAALDAYLGRSIYRLKIAGWWVAVIALCVRLFSSVLTFLRGNLFEAYSKMGVPQAQMKMMNSNPAMRPGVMLGSTLVFSLALLGYMVWIKRYFGRTASAVGRMS